MKHIIIMSIIGILGCLILLTILMHDFIKSVFGGSAAAWITIAALTAAGVLFVIWAKKPDPNQSSDGPGKTTDVH